MKNMNIEKASEALNRSNASPEEISRILRNLRECWELTHLAESLIEKSADPFKEKRN